MAATSGYEWKDACQVALQTLQELVRILVWNLLYSPAASRSALIPANLRDESFS